MKEAENTKAFSSPKKEFSNKCIRNQKTFKVSNSILKDVTMLILHYCW